MKVFEIDVADVPVSGIGAVEGETPVGVDFNAVTVDMATQLFDVLYRAQAVAYVAEAVCGMQMHQNCLEALSPCGRNSAEVFTSGVPETP